MDLFGLLGIILVIAGVYFLLTGGIILGIICIVLGVFLAGGLNYTRGRW